MCLALGRALKGNLGQLENRQMQSSERWDIQLDEGVLGGVKQRNLYGSHIVESVVQLLADGFVLQFLSIQLVF